jgi:hypothetical protein
VLPSREARRWRQSAAARRGAFLAEIDGNLIYKKDDSAIELHWQGKFRGPDFAPLAFQLRTVTHERLKDTKGRLISTVVAQVLSEGGLRDTPWSWA